jgi:SAM-dependent methyltransferase
MSLYEKMLGHPLVFEKLRPLAVGGIDMSPAYRRLAPKPDARILDIGCGTGDALNYLRSFSSYIGIDTDSRAIALAASRHASRPNVRFECRVCTTDWLGSIDATDVTMIGLLHHLDDGAAISLLQMLGAMKSLRRAVTLDIVYLENRRFNNLMARLDRGRYCRTEDGYAHLVQSAGLSISDQTRVRSHPTRGLVDYFIIQISRAEPPLSFA